MPQERLKALDLKNKRALVIDENVHTRKLLIDLLKSFDFGEVSIAPSTTDALAMLQAVKFDFVFCNWTQAPLDSAAFALRVRALEEPGLREIPIFVMKPAAKVSDVVTARDAGVTEFLTVPVSANALLQVFESALVRKRKFVEAENFRGPDRRRRRDETAPVERRKTDREDKTDPKDPKWEV